MVQKRPMNDEELYEVSSKHPRQLEYGQLVSFLEFVPSEGVTRKHHISGEDEGNFASKSESDEKLAKGVITELATCNEDINIGGPECISNSSWPTSSTSEEDDMLEIPFHFQFSPEYYNPNRPTRTVHSVDTYSSLLEHPPRKPISVGPNFQAVVPEWRPHDREKTFNCSDTSEPDLIDCSNDSNKFSGVCIIPFPGSESPACDGDEVGSGRNECYCLDVGSMRCVRQHIMEAREKLQRNLGEQRFEELGFSDMGELVAEKWSEEEEQLFHEVVFSNPASLGKNFWDHLSMVFPFRTKEQIVSYYFNVFMLRKRAEQNRFDSLNIDSDNDEWQGSEDSGDDEVDMIEEGEDSVFESPEYRDDPIHSEIYENVSEIRSTKVLHNCSSDPTPELPCNNIPSDGGGDNSCTSSNAGSGPQTVKSKSIDSKACLGTSNSASGGFGHEYVLEPYDTKIWDYLLIPKSEEDFLPTCSVIEEVFGVGAWNYNGRDGSNGLS